MSGSKVVVVVSEDRSEPESNFQMLEITFLVPMWLWLSEGTSANHNKIAGGLEMTCLAPMWLW